MDVLKQQLKTVKQKQQGIKANISGLYDQIR